MRFHKEDPTSRYLYDWGSVRKEAQGQWVELEEGDEETTRDFAIGKAASVVASVRAWAKQSNVQIDTHIRDKGARVYIKFGGEA